ncbi:MAG: response regulator, partial [Halobaculum sp.]
MRGLISDTLESGGIEVVGEAEDGEEAVAVVRDLQPDVVTMDVNMPEMDGIEATRRIIAKPGGEVSAAVTDLEEQLVELVTSVADADVADRGAAAEPEPETEPEPESKPETESVEVEPNTTVLIGSSNGGP